MALVEFETGQAAKTSLEAGSDPTILHTGPIDVFARSDSEADVRIITNADDRLNPLDPRTIDWTDGWIDRYGPARDRWSAIGKGVTDFAVTHPDDFKDLLLGEEPDMQRRFIELLTLGDATVGDDPKRPEIAPLAYAAVLADLYRHGDEEGPLFEDRRREFLRESTSPFPSDSRGREQLALSLGVFFHAAEGSPEILAGIQADRERLVLGLMEDLSRDTSTALLSESPGVFNALGGRRSYRLQRKVNMGGIPQLSTPQSLAELPKGA